MANRFLFFLLIGSAGILIGLGQWRMYGRAFPCLRARRTCAIFILLPFCFVLPHLLISSLPVGLAKGLAWIGGYWFLFFYYSTLFLILYGVIYAFTGRRPASRFWPAFSAKYGRLVLLLVTVAAIGGTWNAFHPVYRDITVTTEKPLPREYTIAFLTDTHLGPLLSSTYSQDLAARLQATEADAIIFGGDIIDGNLDFVARDGSYKNLDSLTAPLGIYAVYGNHDHYNSDQQKEAALFPRLRFLKNETLLLDDAISLTGLEDFLFYPVKQVPPPDPDHFSILADHEPDRIPAAAAAGYDLYLAGHTHGGQFFPNQLLTERVYELNYGSRLYGTMLAVVSNGYGFWGTPVRIGPPPEIVILHIKHQG